MKLTLRAIILCVITSAYALGQNNFWSKLTGPTGGEFEDIEYDASSGKTFAVSFDNRVYISSDNGANWQRVQELNSARIYDIEIAGGTIYFLSSYDLFVSTDGGTTITQKSIDGQIVYQGYKIKRLSNGNLIILGSGGVLYSSNQGVNWTVGYTPTSPSVVRSVSLAVNSLDQLFIIVQNASNIFRPYRSTDGGISFTELSSHPAGHVHRIESGVTGINVYTVTQTDIYSSANGTTWTSIKSGISDTDISSISGYYPSFIEFSKDGLGMYFVDTRNRKLFSKTLAAASWSTISASFPSAGTDIHSAVVATYVSSVNSQAFFATNSGILRTTNGGSSVTEVNTGLSEVSTTHFIDDNTGKLFIGSGNGGVYRSSNNGASWSRLTALPSSIRELFSTTDKSTLFALSGGTLYRSLDKGDTWPILATPVSFIWAGAADANKIFGLADNFVPAKFYYSSNKGTTWTASPITITGLPADYYIYENGSTGNQGNIFFASANLMLLQILNNTNSQMEYYKIDITYNGSNVITAAVASKITTIPFASIHKFNAQNGKLYFYNRSSSPNRLAVSLNGGTSWTTNNVPTGSDFFVSTNDYVFITDNTDVYISRNSGVAFEATGLPTSTNGSNITAAIVAADNYGLLAFEGDFVHRSSNIIVPPTSPTGLSLTGKSDKSISFRWIDTHLGSEQYFFVIERSTNGVDFQKVAEIEGYDACDSYFTNLDLSAATNYTYRVYARNAAGNSLPTAVLAVTTLADCSSQLPQNRSWLAVNSTESFPLVTPSPTVGVRFVEDGIYEISDIALGLLGGGEIAQRFYFECNETSVAGSNAVKPNGNGTWNGTNTLTLKWRDCNDDKTATITLTLSGIDPNPSSPDPISALVINNTSIEVSWALGFYQKEFVVERSLNASSGFVQVGSTLPYPSNKFVDAGPFVEGTAYHYRVRAKNQNTPALETLSSVASVVFRRPNFVIPTNELANYSAATLGAHWADFNSDGFEDFYTLEYNITTDTSFPVIFKNLGNGNFEKQSIAVPDRAYSLSGNSGDFNNDGFADIGIVSQNPTAYSVFLGNGDFTFVDQNSTQLGDLASLGTNEIYGTSWADINKDGLLDVIVYDTENTGMMVFKQESNHSFTLINAGDLSNDNGDRLNAIWADYDNNGYQDVLLTNTSSSARLYKNNGDETFTLATSTGIDPSPIYGASWGDFNNDGFTDFYASNQTLSSLYRNKGDGTFERITTTSVSEANTSFFSIWNDFNNDGFLDLYTAGFFGQPMLYMRDASSPNSLIFLKVSTEIINENIGRYGIAPADFDRNGFVDIGSASFKFEENGDNVVSLDRKIFKNNNAVGAWSNIKLIPKNSKTSIGSKIVVTDGSRNQKREVTASTGGFSSISPLSHIGLGSATSINNVQVIWPNGTVQNYSNPPINTYLTIEEDTEAPVLTGRVPVNLATDVNTNSFVELTFNEPGNAITGKKLEVFVVGAGSPSFSLLAENAVKTGNSFRFALPAKLSPGVQYEVIVETGAFTDIYNNQFPGIAAGAWRFTTSVGPIVSQLLPLNGATNVLVTSNIELTFNTIVTPVAGKKLKVMDGTTVLADVDVSTTGTISGSKYTLAHTTPFPDDKLLTVLIDAGAFVDANGNDFAGISGTTWQFTTEDKTPPVITFTAPTSLTKGFATATFGATVTDNKNVSLVRVHHKKITAAAFTTVNLAESTTADVYNASISEAMLDAIGIEYFFTARDANNNEARSPAGTATYKTRINYTADATKIPTLGFGGLKNSWKVFSIPFELGSNNSVTSIFDELASLTNKEDYRIIKYKDETNWGEYPADFSSIARGEGYFINIKEAIDIAVGDNLVAPANDRNNLFTINLKQGWNQIGNPYLTPISWSDVAAFNGLTGTAATLKKFSNGTYANQNDLAPFEGGFVFVGTAVNNVSIPFLGQTSSGARTAPGMMWELPIYVSQGDIKNEFGGIGMAEQAAISFDDFDDVNPPHLGDFVEINFQHPEHFARVFAKDIVPVSAEYTWSFNVRAGQEGNTSISWSKELVEDLPGELYLTSDKMLFPIDMRKVNTYVIPSGAEASSFKIYYGKNIGNDLMPFTTVADAAYPNPTSGLLTIPLALPAKGGEQQRVRVELLNTVGGSLGIQMEGVYGSGFHELKLDAGNRMSTDGLVLYKINVENAQGGTVLQGKVMVKK